jgi:hypothetical protein
MDVDVNPDLVLLLRRKVTLRRQMLELQKRNGLAFYKPHSKQDAFHRAGTKFKRRMVRAGNRFGKSECGCAEDCAWLRGARLWLPDGDADRAGGIPQFPVKLLTITTDWDKVDEIWTSQKGSGGTTGKVWRFLPKDGFVKSVKRNNMSVIDTIECANGALWKFDTVRSWKSNPQGSESSDWDAIHVDEPCPEQMFKAAARGLMDRNGAAWFTLTPLSEPWINDYFFPQDTGGLARDTVWAIAGSILDNPTLSREAVDEYVSSLSPDEKECRLNGIPMHLAGLVYKQFRWEKHILQRLPKGWESWSRPPRHWTYYVAIDPHPQTPHAVLFCAVDELGHRFYYYDIFNHCRISTLCDQIKATLDGRHVYSYSIDPCAYIDDPVTEQNMTDEFWRCGIHVEKATKALSDGILKVQASLGAELQMVYFAPTAVRTLWEIQRYSWDQQRPDHPIDKDDHCMECLYRIELQDPTWLKYDPSTGNPVDDMEITGTGIRDDEMELTFDT